MPSGNVGSKTTVVPFSVVFTWDYALKNASVGSAGCPHVPGLPRQRDHHLISKKREWNHCVIKNNPEILLANADFSFQEQSAQTTIIYCNVSITGKFKYMLNNISTFPSLSGYFSNGCHRSSNY